MAENEEKTPIEAGSTVKLKSGGHWMTVEAVNEGQAVCVWMDDKRKVYREIFPIVVLVNQADWQPFA